MGDWVASRIPHCHGFGAYEGLQVWHDGELVAGVVFHNWSPERGTIEISAAADNPRWMTREVLGVVFGYAFAVSRMAFATTAETNEPALKFWRALEAVETKVPDMIAPGVALVVHTLSQEQWERSSIGKRCINGHRR